MSSEIEKASLEQLLKGTIRVTIEHLDVVPEEKIELLTKMANNVLVTVSESWPNDKEISRFEISWMFLTAMLEVLSKTGMMTESKTEQQLLQLCVQSALIVFTEFDAKQLLSRG
jgi:hypothetical protein